MRIMNNEMVHIIINNSHAVCVCFIEFQKFQSQIGEPIINSITRHQRTHSVKSNFKQKLIKSSKSQGPGDERKKKHNTTNEKASRKFQRGGNHIYTIYSRITTATCNRCISTANARKRYSISHTWQVVSIAKYNNSIASLVFLYLSYIY